MRPFERFSLLLWGLIALVVLLHLGYLVHFLGNKTLWWIIQTGGHAAGWVGGGLMLLSLAYIPRKRKWFTRGKVRTWYKLHVILGLAGPLLVSIHSYGKYFGIGGLALGCMWLAACSGVVGYYLYRRLPEEVRNRADRRDALLAELARIEDRRRSLIETAEHIRADLLDQGVLGRFDGSSPVKLPRAGLGREPGRLRDLWRDYRRGLRMTADLKKRIRALARSEARAGALKQQAWLELIYLEQDAGNLLALNEFFSLWRKLHVPVSWFMWWLAGLHLFGWVYY
ncbi:MAG: hypothetical protein KKB20_05860 [Proteobacteria bacterium]|nr:hypothetical protein [Pseudomonadota bacterium]